MRILNEKVLPNGDKAIVISQWTSFLRCMEKHLKNAEIKYTQLDGTVKVDKRMVIVNSINDECDTTKVGILCTPLLFTPFCTCSCSLLIKKYFEFIFIFMS